MSNSKITLFTPRFLGDIVFDATLEEAHDTDMEITDHPIESGASISDHAYLKPRRVSIVGLVSNTDINGKGGQTAPPSNQATGIANTGQGSSGIVHSSADARMSSAYESLLATQELREILDVQTGLYFYPSMMVESLNVIQNKTWEHGALFRCELVQVTVTETLTERHPEGKLYTSTKSNKKGGTRGKSKSSDASQVATANRVQSPQARGQISPQSTEKADVRKQSALCKITGVCG